MENDASPTMEKITYERKDLLGSGGFANVFKGRLKTETVGGEIIDEREVAIKRIELAKKENQLFGERESEQRKLDHPNVVKLLHVEEDDDFLYLALELCESSLDKVFLLENDPNKYKGPLPGDIEFLLQLSRGLEYIHNRNLVHRDIKPENVLISIKSSVGLPVLKWADFGLSKKTTKRGDYDLSGNRGTLTYMAPETLKAISETEDRSISDSPEKIILNATSDIFAFGIVIFKFLTKGVHPFGSTLGIIDYIKDANPINIKKLSSKHFAFEIIEKMLSLEPKNRLILREIIVQLGCLQHKLDFATHPEQSAIEKAIRQLNKMKEEFHNLCSNPDPLKEEEINQINLIFGEDLIGLVNLVDKNGYSPLHMLCRNGQSSTLHRCMESFSKSTILDINYQDRNGFNALHQLVMNHQGEHFPEIFKHLINLDEIDVNITDHELDRNVLQLILKHSNGRDLIYIVQLLIDKDIDLKHKHIHGWTVLHYLCRHYTNRNLSKVAELLINHGAAVNEKDSDQWTALHVLCRSDHNIQHLIETIQVLISKGIEINLKNSAGWTAFHTLVRYYTDGNLMDVFELLIKNGADVNEKESGGWTVLHILCRSYVGNDLINLIQFLISNGAEVNAKTSDGCAALHFLARFYTGNKLIELVRLLIENGADINAKKISDGWTTLHFLCQFYTQDDLIELIKLLIESRVEINVHESDGGWTPLHMLCASYQHENLIEIIQLLIKNEVDLQSKMLDGTTALDLLNQRKDESYCILEVIQLFDSMKERV